MDTSSNHHRIEDIDGQTRPLPPTGKQTRRRLIETSVYTRNSAMARFSICTVGLWGCMGYITVTYADFSFGLYFEIWFIYIDILIDDYMKKWIISMYLSIEYKYKNLLFIRLKIRIWSKLYIFLWKIYGRVCSFAQSNAFPLIL